MSKERNRKLISESTPDGSQAYHIPVLLKEATVGLEINPSGVYVDCTFGGGGHAREILKQLNGEGKLFVFDQDIEVKDNLPEDQRFVFIPHNFRHIQRFLRLHKIVAVDGILADLGVSSHQFDQPERGFSTRFEGDMDMRMDRRQENTAFDVVNSYSEPMLHKIFEQYGEVTNSKTLAKTIVQVRQSVSLKTISNFKNAVQEVVKGNPNKYFAQVFQALRIEVNDELAALKELLQQVPLLLKPGGRVAIITFHSLEDRIVKNFFKKGNFIETEDTNPFANVHNEPIFKIITRKPIVPNETESGQNRRSRSAKLRIAEKL